MSLSLTHRNRPACEITVSLKVESSLSEDWPIFVRQRCGTPQSLAAHIGDLVVFEGTKLGHWRELFEGDRHMQTSLHYVRRDGPNARFMFDEGRNLR